MCQRPSLAPDQLLLVVRDFPNVKQSSCQSLARNTDRESVSWSNGSGSMSRARSRSPGIRRVKVPDPPPPDAELIRAPAQRGWLCWAIAAYVTVVAFGAYSLAHPDTCVMDERTGRPTEHCVRPAFPADAHMDLHVYVSPRQSVEFDAMQLVWSRLNFTLSHSRGDKTDGNTAATARTAAARGSSAADDDDDDDGVVGATVRVPLPARAVQPCDGATGDTTSLLPPPELHAIAVLTRAGVDPDLSRHGKAMAHVYCGTELLRTAPQRMQAAADAADVAATAAAESDEPRAKGPRQNRGARLLDFPNTLPLAQRGLKLVRRWIGRERVNDAPGRNSSRSRSSGGGAAGGGSGGSGGSGGEQQQQREGGDVEVAVGAGTCTGAHTVCNDIQRDAPPKEVYLLCKRFEDLCTWSGPEPVRGGHFFVDEAEKVAAEVKEHRLEQEEVEVAANASEKRARHKPCRRLLWRPTLTLSLLHTESWFARARMPAGLSLKMYTLAHRRGLGGGSGVYMPVFNADDSQLPMRDWLMLGGNGIDSGSGSALQVCDTDVGADDGGNGTCANAATTSTRVAPAHGSLHIRLRHVSVLRHVLSSELPRWFREEAGFSEESIDELKVLLRPTELAVSLAAYALLGLQVLLVRELDETDAAGSGVGVGVGTDAGGLALSPAMLLLRLTCAVTALLHLMDGGGGGSGENSIDMTSSVGDSFVATAVSGGASTVVMVWAILAVLTELWKLVLATRGSARRAANKDTAPHPRTCEQWQKRQELRRLTHQLQSEHAAAARIALLLLAPVAAGFALRSLLLMPQRSWYSWAIATLAETLYICGIALMLPPVVRNFRLGTVPPPRRPPLRNRWLLTYRIVCALSDDVVLLLAQTHSTGLPTAHALACLRDDVVLLIELAQSYGPLRLPIDEARGAEVENCHSKLTRVNEMTA